MARTEREDAYFKALKEREASHPHGGRTLPNIQPSTHVWVGTLPADASTGTHVIHIKATDMFGQVEYGKRIIRVE
jgi:hypothetical protein